MAEPYATAGVFQKSGPARRVLYALGSPTDYELDMATSNIAPRGRGRPSKGARFGAHVKLPQEFRDAIEALAERDGLPIGAIICRFVADGLGRPAPDYCSPVPKNQQELPLASKTLTVEEPLPKSA